MKRTFWWIGALILIIAVALLITSDPGESAYKAPAVNTPIRSDVTTLVQTRLRDFGYTIVVDGLYGKQTRRVVASWQRSNGLTIDGIAGSETLRSLGPLAPAVRLTPPPPPVVVESGALPTKSPEACADMSAYRQAAGLPEQFDAIGYREGGCRNDSVSPTGCCFGFWQNFLSSHLSSQSAYRDRIINECGVTSRNDILGNTDNQKAASACVTFVVYSISGMSPWAL